MLITTQISSGKKLADRPSSLVSCQHGSPGLRVDSVLLWANMVLAEALV